MRWFNHNISKAGEQDETFTILTIWDHQDKNKEAIRCQMIYCSFCFPHVKELLLMQRAYIMSNKGKVKNSQYVDSVGALLKDIKTRYFG
jgi:hypothetical protein